MKFAISIVFFLISLSHNLQAQYFFNSIDSLENYNGYGKTSLPISGLPLSIDSTNGLEYITLTFADTGNVILDAYLEAPDGTMIDLSYRGFYNHTVTSVKYISKKFANSDVATISGIESLIPYDGVGVVNNGQNPNGEWNLFINVSTNNNCSLTGFGLSFGANAGAPTIQFLSSNLPIVVINTNGQQIIDDPKIIADMGIIFNGAGNRNNASDPFNHYSGKIGIELRGQTSQTLFQKQYGFETRDPADPDEDKDVSLLGMPKESDWILYAPADDKSLMRNYLSYNWSRKMGNYASRTQYCELIINGEYQGVYILMEKIKRNKNRVNISKMETGDSTGTAYTGGYIISSDKGEAPGNYWSTPFRNDKNVGTLQFQYVYPKPEDINSKQKQYIADYVDSFKVALFNNNFTDSVYGYKKYIDINSFIDFWIINELSLNIDGYVYSTYLFKDNSTKNGKLSAGPVWDFNIAYGNVDYGFGNTTQGWRFYNYTDFNHSIGQWYTRFLQDSVFTNRLKNRWNTLRMGFLNDNAVNSYVDSTIYTFDEARKRHYSYYKVLGSYVWPNPQPIPNTYEGEVSYLKKWISARAQWIDENINKFPLYYNPILTNYSVETLQDSIVYFDLSTNSIDLQNSGLTYSISATPASGSVSVDTLTGIGTYTPSPGSFGADEFSYSACNTYGVCSSGKVNVYIKPFVIINPIKPILVVLESNTTTTGNIFYNLYKDSTNYDSIASNYYVQSVISMYPASIITTDASGNYTYLSLTEENDNEPIDTIIYRICHKQVDYCINDTIHVKITKNDGVTSVAERSLDLAVKAYPNPFDNNFTVEWTEPFGNNVTVNVLDITSGNALFDKLEFENAGNYKRIAKAGGLTKGLYLLKLQSNTTHEAKYFKIIKQ